MEIISPSAHTANGPLNLFRLPPSPPATVHGLCDSSTGGESDVTSPSCDVSESKPQGSRAYPLPPKPRRNKVLPEDLKTPDSHVERDPRLIRLTGIHPFNVEAPLSDLYNEGFLTTKDLHYVRNHGPVPRVDDAQVLDWEFTVEGMVETPLKLTLRDLIRDYEQATYPITLVCAGNRRKEQNVVRKTKGFSWGPAGLSTALWTGVALGDLLARAAPKRGARYVCFEGADKLPNGYYGTSVKLNWAMDPNRGIMVAHRMNGEALHPDHGKPLRIVIPGQIGGRSVKWLKRIVVSSSPSDNWYHIYDNRVLPTMITPEASASLPDVWKDERYAIYDLNTNSAICYPAHDEKVSLSEGPKTYNFRGYAYAGGGKRVTRLEVTLDQGKTWTLANITYPEDQYRLAPENEVLFGGRLDMSWREACFCWCFWDLDIPLSDLGDAKDVMIRAMDDSMMVQPRDMYWSVLGMMNNPWFRVVIHKDAGSLRFEHPTQPTIVPGGGWMERVKKEGGNLTNGFWGEKSPTEEDAATEPEAVKDICLINEKVTRQITIDELRKHDGEEQPWFVVNGQVYDGTKFLEGHPGGAASIIGGAGQNITEEFLAIHSENAKAMMPDYHIGSLDAQSLLQLINAAEPPSSPEANDLRPVFLQSKTWSKALLSRKRKISPDTKIFTFNLNHAAQTVGLPVGQHLMMRLRDPKTNEAILRAYTPISEGTDTGELHVLVKIYYDGPGWKGGRMTQALDELPVGQALVDFKGPVGKFEYRGKGLCALAGKGRRVRRFVMICAGSGVTPIFQVLRAVMKDEEDRTRCVVLDGNRVEGDILCRAELDALAALGGGGGGGNRDGDGDKCRLVYTLSRPEASWRGLKGRMDRALFEREVGRPVEGDNDTLVLVCGPEGMEKTCDLDKLHSDLPSAPCGKIADNLKTSTTPTGPLITTTTTMRQTLRLLARIKPAARFLEAGAPTGLTGVLTHASPRSTLIYLYSSTLEKLQAAPEHSLYRQSVEALTKHRLSLVEATQPAGYSEWAERAQKLVADHPDQFGALSSGHLDGSASVRVERDGKLFVVRHVLKPRDQRLREWDGEVDDGPNLEGTRTAEEMEQENQLHRERMELSLKKGVAWEPEPQLSAEQIEELETKIGAGLIEEVVEVAEGELKLVDTMLQAKVWESLEEQPNEGQWVYFERKA
ncbi:hypothetical protein B0T17DRAFT_506282 [Bombardia bombarda]|uniref:Nitrate reductase [NADPH] n=1 Tax=Bombardia bombarda TaxID=252184 RepID=A0AA39XAA8_9PEZI|nr:hypothetical protein B0T17DRAFT_506282 [Bombardia bombarda]